MKIIKIFLVLLFAVRAYSQDKINNEYKILIDSSVIIKAKNLQNFYNEKLKRNTKADKNSAYSDDLKKHSNDIYVVDENYKAIIINTAKYGISLKTLDVYDKKNKSLLKKGISVWKVIPVLKGDVLTITIIDANMYYKNKKYNFINGGGSTIVFQYSCEEKKWVLIKEEHTGI